MAIIMDQKAKIIHPAQFQQDESFNKDPLPLKNVSSPQLSSNSEDTELLTYGLDGYNEPKSKRNSSGGGNMSQYVTHEELKHVEDNLRHEIKESKLELTDSIKDTKTELNGSINDLSGKINALVTKIDAQATTLNWIKNIITAGIVIPLITYVVMFIVKHH